MKTEIDHREKLSYEEFAKEYPYPNKPVVITGALREWKALSRWSPEFFKKEFGDMKFTLNEKVHGTQGYKGDGTQGVEYTMASFIDRVLASTEQDPRRISAIRSCITCSRL